MSIESSCANSKISTQVNHAFVSGSPSGVPGPAGPPGCPIISQTTIVESPVLGRAYLGYFNGAAEILKVMVVLKGSSPILTANVHHGVNFIGVGTPLFSTPFSVDNVSVGVSYELADFAQDAQNIAAGSHLWLNITNLSVGVDDIMITVVYVGECEPVIVEPGSGTGGGTTDPIDLTNVGIKVVSSTGQIAYLNVTDNS